MEQKVDKSSDVYLLGQIKAELMGFKDCPKMTGTVCQKQCKKYIDSVQTYISMNSAIV